MKKNRQTWDDFLFENRNKEYGAYELRTTAAWNLLKSLLVVVFMLGIVITAFSAASKDHPVTYDRNIPPVYRLTKIETEKPPIIPQKPKPTRTVQTTAVQKTGSDAVPEPVSDPTEEQPLARQNDLGLHPGEDDDAGTAEPGAYNPAGSDGDPVTVPADPEPKEAETLNSKQVSRMAVFPGCENSKSNDQLTRCMAEKLSQELALQLADFEETAQKQGIERASSRLSFIVDSNGQIVQIRPVGNGNTILGTEAQKALDRISKRMIKKGKLIKPAEAKDGSAVNLIFNIPIRYSLNHP